MEGRLHGVGSLNGRRHDFYSPDCRLLCYESVAGRLHLYVSSERRLQCYSSLSSRLMAKVKM